MTDRKSLDQMTSNDLDALYARLDQAETELRWYTEADSANAAAGSYAHRAERAEAAIARVAAVAEEYPAGIDTALIHEALDEPAPRPDATPATGHVYLSTGCHHGEHTYCKSMTGMNGAKRPASCKFCAVPCICLCHTDQPKEQQ
jgi:hypothetical protein